MGFHTLNLGSQEWIGKFTLWQASLLRTPVSCRHSPGNTEAVCTFSFVMLGPRGGKAGKLRLSLPVLYKAEESFDFFFVISLKSTQPFQLHFSSQYEILSNF